MKNIGARSVNVSRSVPGASPATGSTGLSLGIGTLAVLFLVAFMLLSTGLTIGSDESGPSIRVGEQEIKDPVLDPVQGSIADVFNFQVTFTNRSVVPKDPFSQAANRIALVIDGVTTVPMHPFGTNPPFEWYYEANITGETILSSGKSIHEYYFICQTPDGKNIREPANGTYKGPVLTPSLFDGKVTPDVGSNTEQYTFSVVYKDDSNREPQFVKLQVDGKPFGEMQQLNSGSTDYFGGETFYRNVPGAVLGVGSHSFTFTTRGYDNHVFETQLQQGPFVSEGARPDLSIDGGRDMAFTKLAGNDWSIDVDIHNIGDVDIYPGNDFQVRFSIGDPDRLVPPENLISMVVNEDAFGKGIPSGQSISVSTTLQELLGGIPPQDGIYEIYVTANHDGNVLETQPYKTTISNNKAQATLTVGSDLVIADLAPTCVAIDRNSVIVVGVENIGDDLAGNVFVHFYVDGAIQSPPYQFTPDELDDLNDGKVVLVEKEYVFKSSESDVLVILDVQGNEFEPGNNEASMIVYSTGFGGTATSSFGPPLFTVIIILFILAVLSSRSMVRSDRGSVYQGGNGRVKNENNR